MSSKFFIKVSDIFIFIKTHNNSHLLCKYYETLKLTFHSGFEVFLSVYFSIYDRNV